jgi:hypothetical protein
MTGTKVEEDDKRRIGALKDEIKHRDRRIEELRREIDEQRDLIQRLSEHAEDYANCLESWKETFGLEMTEDGSWTNAPFWKEHWQTIDDYNKIVQDWNKCLPLINGRRQNVGRPLAASEAQCVQVLKLQKAARSLREIADETSLGLATVRTIIAKKNGIDRTTEKHRGRIDPDRQRIASWKRQKRTGDALPKRAQRVVEEGRALIKESKGLGRTCVGGQL